MRSSSAEGAPTFTLAAVELEITPEPDEDGRAAIEAALGELGRDDPVPGRWGDAGVREATGRDADEA
jgi:hypothetical protein